MFTRALGYVRGLTHSHFGYREAIFERSDEMFVYIDRKNCCIISCCMLFPERKDRGIRDGEIRKNTITCTSLGSKNQGAYSSVKVPIHGFACFFSNIFLLVYNLSCAFLCAFTSSFQDIASTATDRHATGSGCWALTNRAFDRAREARDDPLEFFSDPLETALDLPAKGI